MISDIELKNVIGLKWLPWIGDQFLSVPNDKRLLIVGESHYHDSTPQSIQKHNSPIFTREVIEELAIERCYYGTKIFPNLHRALFRNDEFDSSTFWNLVSFYNFIQRPMETNNGRPSNKDFNNGWNVFLEIMSILKPKTCLFIGTTAANYMVNALQQTKYTTESVKWDEWISNASPKTAIIKDKENNETHIIFIKHTSQFFNWDKWNDYLQTKIPKELKWFEENTNTYIVDL